MWNFGEVQRHTGHISRSLLSMWWTESHLVCISHRSCSGLTWTIQDGFPCLNHPLALLHTITSSNTSWCEPDPWMTQTTTWASTMGLDTAVLPSDEELSFPGSTLSDAAHMTCPEQRSTTCAKHMILWSSASKAMSCFVNIVLSFSIMVPLFDALSRVKCPTLREKRYHERLSITVRR